MEEKSKLKKVSSLIGGIATHTLSGSILFYYTLLPYRYSYLKRINTELKSMSLSYIMPVSFMLMFLFSWFGSFLERKTNPRVALFVGNLIIVLSAGLLYLSKSALIDYFLFAFYGIGIGINNISCMRCIFYRFPSFSKQGRMVGISMSGYALAAGLTIMANVMINPEAALPTINFNGEGEYIYPMFITNRMQFFILIYIGVLSVFSAISILCLCSYETVMPEVDNRALLRKSNISSISEDAVNVTVEPLMTTNWKNIFKSTSFYFFIMISILSTYGTFVCLFTFYELGKYQYANTLMLTYCPLGFLFASGIGRLIWGIMYDKTRFKLNMYIILGSQIVLCLVFNFAVKWSWVYLVILSLIGFTYGGVMVIFVAYMGQFYGREIGLEVYGFISCGKAFSAIFSMSMVSILAAGDFTFANCCLSMCVVGAVANLICILFIIFASDDLEIIDE